LAAICDHRRLGSARSRLTAGRSSTYGSILLLRSLGIKSRDVAGQHPDVVREIRVFMDAAHVDSPHWPIEAKPRQKKDSSKSQRSKP
jgi:hypothetical protein